MFICIQLAFALFLLVSIFMDMKIEFRIVLRSRFGLCGGKVKEQKFFIMIFYYVVVADKNKCLKTATKKLYFMVVCHKK